MRKKLTSDLTVVDRVNHGCGWTQWKELALRGASTAARDKVTTRVEVPIHLAFRPVLRDTFAECERAIANLTGRSRDLLWML